jgi:hypothetical protein
VKKKQKETKNERISYLQEKGLGLLEDDDKIGLKKVMVLFFKG